MGLVADRMREAAAKADKRLTRDTLDGILEDAHDVFCFSETASYQQRAHSYIALYGVERPKCAENTAVMACVYDLIARTRDLCGGDAAQKALAERDARIEELEGRLASARKALTEMAGLCEHAADACVKGE